MMRFIHGSAPYCGTMRALSVMILLAALVLPTVAFAATKTITASHTYVLGDHDSKEDLATKDHYE